MKVLKSGLNTAPSCSGTTSYNNSSSRLSGSTTLITPVPDFYSRSDFDQNGAYMMGPGLNVNSNLNALNGGTINGGYSSNVTTGTMNGTRDVFGTTSTNQFGSAVAPQPNGGINMWRYYHQTQPLDNGYYLSTPEPTASANVVTTTTTPDNIVSLGSAADTTSVMNSATPYYFNYRQPTTTIGGFSALQSSRFELVKRPVQVVCDPGTGQLKTTTVGTYGEANRKGVDNTAGSGESPRAGSLPENFGYGSGSR